MVKDKIVITGTGGFIGGALLLRLLERYPTRNFISIDRRGLYFKSERVVHYQQDINNGLPDLDDVRIVVHLAAFPSIRDSDKQVESVIKDNIFATQNTIDKCISNWKPKRLIITSSSSVYDGSVDWHMKENGSKKLLSLYAVSKITNENTLKMYQNNGKLNEIEGVCIRPFPVYGPNQRDELCIQAIINSFIKDTAFFLYGDGSVKRDFTYIDDTCAAIEALMFAEKLNHSTYNIGTGENISINEVIYKISKHFNKPLKIKHEPPTIYDTKFTRANINRINEDTGWKPLMDFDEGLKKQIEYQQRMYDLDMTTNREV